MLAGCGGSESATPNEDARDRQRRDDTPSASQTVSVGSEGESQFDPASVTVSVGDTVAWEWGSGATKANPAGVTGPGRPESGATAATATRSKLPATTVAPLQGLGMTASVTHSEQEGSALVGPATTAPRRSSGP